MQTDVLIVGGGLTGLALAAALGETRLKVTLLDARPRPPDKLAADDFSAGVIALGPSSKQFIEKLGAWQHLAKASISAFQQILVADGAGTGSIKFSAADEGLSELGFIVGRANLAAALDKVVDEQGVATHWGCQWSRLKKTPEGYRLHLSGKSAKDQDEVINTQLLVGADGSASAVREALGIRTYGRPYPQRAHTCLARLAQSHQQTACQWFTDSGPLAFLPLSDYRANDMADQPNDKTSANANDYNKPHGNSNDNSKDNTSEGTKTNHYAEGNDMDKTSDGAKAKTDANSNGKDKPDDKLVAVVWSSTEAISGLSDQDLAARLTQASEGHLGRVVEVTQRGEFPLAHRQTLRYAKKGAVILGDAAHVIHPLAGWGANLGFADAEQLAREVWQAQLLGKSPGNRSVLRRYEIARVSQNLMAGAVMEGFHLMYQTTNPVLSLVRSRCLDLAQDSPRLKSLFVKSAG